MVRKIQDFKLSAGDQVGDILWECPIEDGATMENLVHERMKGHYETKSGVQGVRVILEDGSELYRWTWWDEASQRQQSTNAEIGSLVSAELERRRGSK